MKVPATALIQPARRVVQLAVLLFIVFIAFFSMYGVLKHSGLLIKTDVRFFQAVYYTMDAVAGNFFETHDEVMDASRVLKGSTWVFSLGGFKLADPLAVLSYFISSRTMPLSLLFAVMLPVTFTLLFGRAFCGWICPMNTLLESIDWTRKHVSFLDVSFSRKTKYYLLGLGLFLALMGLPLLPLIYPPLIIGKEIYNYVYYVSLGSGAVLLLGIVLFELFVSRRAWCRYFCPGGALFTLLGARSLIRLRKDDETCVQKICMECREACVLGLDPVSGRDMEECSNCGQCIAHCPPGALKYAVSLPRGFKDDKKNKSPGN
jgi:ferredoxin-type protein NapH